MKAQMPNQTFTVSEISLHYKPTLKAIDRPKVTKSQDAYKLMLSNWDLNTIDLLEKFYIILLNPARHVIGFSQISSGGVMGTVVDPKIIFAIALKCCATGMVLCHNHPSGNLNPSRADINITQKLLEGGKFLDIEVTDHIIVTSDGFYSFADNGLL